MADRQPSRRAAAGFRRPGGSRLRRSAWRICKAPCGPPAATAAAPPPRPDFGGGRVQFVQIGLGTNTTFIQNLAGPAKDWSPTIDWLLQATSERSRQLVRGVAVEPVADLIQALAPAAAQLPFVHLVQAAIGEAEREGVEVHTLQRKALEDLLARVPEDRRDDLEYDMQFILNMSTVGAQHPEIKPHSAYILSEYGVDPSESLSTVRADVWSYGQLCKALNFRGCEVLMIDAEGHDARILRSLVEHCRQQPECWPDLIQLETRGHSDRFDWYGAEWDIVRTLERMGYLLVAYSHADTHLVRIAALSRARRLHRWVSTWRCGECRRTYRFPYVGLAQGTYCKRCLNL